MWLLTSVAGSALTTPGLAATVVKQLQVHCRFTKELKKKPNLDQYTSGGKFRATKPNCIKSMCLWLYLIQHDHCSTTAEAGLKYFDLQPGSGDEIVQGKVVKVCNIKLARYFQLLHALSCETDNSRLQVHFDCMYRSLDVVSSRSARLLGANRSIAEVGIHSSASSWGPCAGILATFLLPS